MAIEHMGGKCIFCGYNKYEGALGFHHKDGNQKSFSISSAGLTRSWKRVENEIEKCVLGCSNCHKELHAGILQLPCESKADKQG